MRLVNVLLEAGAAMPRKGSEGAAAWDLCANGDTIIHGNSFGTVSTGVRLELDHHCAIISHRSGHNAQSGIEIYGLIDPDYRGEVLVSVHNFGINSWHIKHGERIAQMRLAEVPEIKLRLSERLSTTIRGEGRHGSTG